MKCKIISSARDEVGSNVYLVVEVDTPGNTISSPMPASNTYEDVPEWRRGADRLTEEPLPYLPIADQKVVFCRWPSREAVAVERFLQMLDTGAESAEPATPLRRTLAFNESTRTLTRAERIAAELKRTSGPGR